MKVQKIEVRDWFGNAQDSLCVNPLGDRLYKLAKAIEVNVYTDEGLFHYEFQPGFITNFRSGGLFVDRFIDQIGSSVNIQVCWLVHDSNYTPCYSLEMEHPVSKKLGDRLLKAMLEFSEMPKFKACMVYTSVKWFGNSAYEEDDELTEKNSRLFSFEWGAR